MTKRYFKSKLSSDASIIIALLRKRVPLTYTELAKETKVNLTTVYRTVGMLLERGIVSEREVRGFIRSNYKMKKHIKLELNTDFLVEEAAYKDPEYTRILLERLRARMAYQP